VDDKKEDFSFLNKLRFAENEKPKKKNESK